MAVKPLAIDLCCGLGGWTEGLLEVGYDVIGFDIEQHIYGEERYPGMLVIQDVLTLHGRQFRNVDLIVASPPCQAYSWMAMPWGRAKAKAAAIRADTIGDALERLNRLFDACFRIQREACEAAGRHIPMVVENVKGAQPWVGRAAWNFGSFYLWGDVPALMPIAAKSGVKVGGMGWYPPDDPRHQIGAAFNPAAQGRAFTEAREGRKVPGFRFDGSGRSFQTAAVEGVKVPSVNGKRRTNVGSGARFTSRDCGLEADGIKVGGDWFSDPHSPSRQSSSKSPARKAASAKIAKIPISLSTHIAKCYYPIAQETA